MSCELVVLIDVTGSLTYIGESPVNTAQAEDKWRIVRVNQATSGTIVSYADSVTTFTKSWSNRATYAYTVS